MGTTTCVSNHSVAIDIATQSVDWAEATSAGTLPNLTTVFGDTVGVVPIFFAKDIAQRIGHVARTSCAISVAIGCVGNWINKFVDVGLLLGFFRFEFFLIFVVRIVGQPQRVVFVSFVVKQSVEFSLEFLPHFFRVLTVFRRFRTSQRVQVEGIAGRVFHGSVNAWNRLIMQDDVLRLFEKVIDAITRAVALVDEIVEVLQKILNIGFVARGLYESNVSRSHQGRWVLNVRTLVGKSGWAIHVRLALSQYVRDR